ncbi:metal-dependent hydrolase [Actinocorallia sp. API 0066]|uniref:metal-dependent hydrolase n=1 Tax=Actinocorallia sp. API 0066 TaxID=2896846 RepID=UPI001E441B7B|nr:metal-dependent hydrolase [Actinocorallia sp. API 0066]MCD0448020.1 metal-dependent hydrolase [Actinocorallia sp. API 0066]
MTEVTFPHGAVTGESTVRRVIPYGADWAVITDSTPFHPVDHRWPDQPGDHGTIWADGPPVSVVDCVTGAAPVDGGDILTGGEITARRDDPGWRWLVLHVVRSPSDLLGRRVLLEVDVPRREALSSAHSLCHLSGLALNRLLADLWSKEHTRDTLGSADFDGSALTRSEISVNGFHDTYRLGRSLRRAGFRTGLLPETVPDLGGRLTAQVNAWIDTGAPVRIKTAGPGLTASRSWVCGLPEGEAEVLCGGTHPRTLTACGRAALTAELSADATELHVRGLTRMAPDPCDRGEETT